MSSGHVFHSCLEKIQRKNEKTISKLFLVHDVIHLKSSLKWPKILQIHGNRDRSSLKGAHQVSPAMFQVHLEQSNMELMVIIAIINIEKENPRFHLNN